MRDSRISSDFIKEVLMNAKQKIHQAKLNQWISLFKEQADSGLTVRQWCEKNNYSFHTYNYWKHILKEEYAAAVLPDIVPVFPSVPALPTPVSPNETSGMTQTISHNSRDLRDSCHTNTIRIMIGDTEISLGSSSSDEMICRIIQAVRHA